MHDLLSPIEFVIEFFSSDEIIRMLVMIVIAALCAAVLLGSAKTVRVKSDAWYLYTVFGGFFAVTAAGGTILFVVLPLMVPVVFYGLPLLIVAAACRLAWVRGQRWRRRRRTEPPALQNWTAGLI